MSTPSRTDAAAVQAILGKNWDNLTVVTPFIETASMVMDGVAACAIDNGETLTDFELEIIERWLSAHYYLIMDQIFSAKRSEGAIAQFQGKTNMYLESTIYGQTAMRLDRSGCLNAIGGAEFKKARGFWLGRDPVDQTCCVPGVGRGFDPHYE
jgi:hypothetical protein